MSRIFALDKSWQHISLLGNERKAKNLALRSDLLSLHFKWWHGRWSLNFLQVGTKHLIQFNLDSPAKLLALHYVHGPLVSGWDIKNFVLRSCQCPIPHACRSTEARNEGCKLIRSLGEKMIRSDDWLLVKSNSRHRAHDWFQEFIEISKV